MTQNTMYHRFLRVAATVCALVLVFESGIVNQTTKVLSINAHNYLANAVGMSASVKPTELNTITADLARREKALSEREAALNEREIAVGLQDGSGALSTNNSTATFLLAAILFILLVLIVLNYILDYLRSKERELATPV